MRKLLTVLVMSVLAAGIVSAAGKDVRRDDHPMRYLPRALDGAIVQVQNDVDGRIWSAWAYRNGAEYDLALSVSDTPGIWSEPRLIGLDDRMNQGQPTLAVDARGTTYLAYAGGDGTLHVQALRAHSDSWSPAVGVSDDRGRVSAPSLMIVGETLVLGYRLGEGVELVTLPLLPSPTDSTTSIYDGPDPTGEREEEEDDDSQDDATDEITDHDGVNLLPRLEDE